MKLALTAGLLLASPAIAQQDETRITAAAPTEKVAWFGTLESARREAARTNRPIFLLAARPCAGGVPGFW